MLFIIPKGQLVSVHYTGYLNDLNGKKFDTSVGRGQRPLQFQIGMMEVIRGWDEGILEMSIGEKAILKCSADYAYGEDGVPPVIPPNTDLVFEVELIAIN